MIAKTHRWQKTAVAAAAVALLGLSGTGAYALSLGRLTVLSALGEPLRAEVEVPDITAEEAASLRAAVAQPEAFTAAGLEYSASLTSLQASLQRRPDGRAYLRLTSDRTVNDPFVDLILEATWSSGRIMRDYTLLLDPPSLKKPVPAPTLAQTPTTTNSAAIAPSNAPLSVAPPAKPTASESSRPASPARSPAQNAAAPVAKSGGSSDKQITVKSGDTASKIANAHKSEGVSLDQMLVALLRANPDAFINDNLNRVRAGAVMTVPTAESASNVPPAEASKIVIAQSKDFNDFRRNLAANAPQAAVSAADRKASGAIEAKVDEKKFASPAPDKLTLSKGIASSKNDDARIAKEREAKDAAARAAELTKNISDLSKFNAATTPAGAASATKPTAPNLPTLPVAAVAAPSSPAPAASTPTVATSAPVPLAVPAAPQPATSAPASPASAVASAPAPAKAVAPAPSPELEEPSPIDTLMDDPMVPAGAAGLLALLGGFGLYRLRQRKKNASQVDSSFLESRLQPDSFFGASGGQRVDTNQNGPVSASSMVYSASQLDAADDVDPVAEADVYLAYGRDLQAEEILKEAVRTNPGRLAIHTKLLEIFAKRRDARSFESAATQAYKLTGAISPEWARICEMGLAIDPTNPLYQPGGAPSAPLGAGTAASPVSDFGTSTIAESAQAELEPVLGTGVDLDLDLDFSLDDEPVGSAISDVTGETLELNSERTVKIDTPYPDNALNMDFDLGDDEPSPQAGNFDPVSQIPEISLSLDDLDVPPLNADTTAPVRFESTSPAPVEPVQPANPTADTGLMEFDLGSLSMELDDPSELPTSAPDNLSEDPLGTKLALAEEFISIGDEDGARALIEEVISEATGDMRAQAQKALAQLS